MKKVVSILLTVSMIACSAALPFTAVAAETADSVTQTSGSAPKASFTAENTDEISYRIVSLPDRLEYNIGENISLKGLQIEVKTGNEEPVVYTYPDVAFAHDSNTPKPAAILLLSDYRSDKAGTYKVEVLGADNVSFDVKVVDSAVTANTTAIVNIIDVSGNTILVKPAEGSAELKVSDIFTLSAKQITDNVRPVVGMKLEVTYSGCILETYPAQFGDVKKVSVVSDNTAVMGDVNADGSLSISDVVLLQEWLLAVPGTKLANWKAADLCEDNRLDVFDLCLMKRALINGVTAQPAGLDNTDNASDIVVFEMDLSDTGVEEFLADNPTIESSYKDDELYNITPQEITDNYGFKIFKYSKNCETYLEYKGEVYQLGSGWGGPGTVSFAVADLNNDGYYELYFTYSWGSGLNHANISCFDTSSSTNFEGFDTYWSNDVVFAVENGKLGVYKAKYTSLSGTEKLGEINADNDTKKIIFVPVDSSDALTQNKLRDIVTIKTDFRPEMSDLSGIGILLEVNSPDYPVTLKTTDGHFTEWDIKKGSGTVKAVGQEYDTGKNGYIFWTPDKLSYQDGFESKIQVVGISGDVFIDLGYIYVSQVKDGRFVASFEKPDTTAGNDVSTIKGKTFVYEKEGLGGDFTINFNEDGTFIYSTGYLSSYLGSGEWEIKDDTVIMTENTSDIIHHLKIAGSDLVYIAEGSDNFYGFFVNDGEKFFIKSDNEKSLA